MSLPVGTVVTFYNPGNAEEHESWCRGVIKQTLASGHGKAVHVIAIDAFKWDADAPWGAYDGVPELLGRETNGAKELEFMDTWPRRR